MARNISSIIAVLFTTVVLSGCGAGMPNAADPSSQEARLAKLEAENKELRTKLEESKAEGQKEEAVNEEDADKIPKRGLLDGKAEASDAEPPMAKPRTPLSRLLANSEVVPPACGGIGPGAAYVGGFPLDLLDDSKGVKRGGIVKSACGGRCLAIRNKTAYYIALYIDDHAVTVCNGRYPAQTLRVIKPGHDKPTIVSVVGPSQIAKIGGLLGHITVKARYFDLYPYVAQVKENPRLVSVHFPYRGGAWGFEQKMED